MVHFLLARQLDYYTFKIQCLENAHCTVSQLVLHQVFQELITIFGALWSLC